MLLPLRVAAPAIAARVPGTVVLGRHTCRRIEEVDPRDELPSRGTHNSIRDRASQPCRDPEKSQHRLLGRLRPAVDQREQPPDAHRPTHALVLGREPRHALDIDDVQVREPVQGGDRATDGQQSCEVERRPHTVRDPQAVGLTDVLLGHRAAEHTDVGPMGETAVTTGAHQHASQGRRDSQRRHDRTERRVLVTSFVPPPGPVEDLGLVGPAESLVHTSRSPPAQHGVRRKSGRHGGDAGIRRLRVRADDGVHASPEPDELGPAKDSVTDAEQCPVVGTDGPHGSGVLRHGCSVPRLSRHVVGGACGLGTRPGVLAVWITGRPHPLRRVPGTTRGRVDLERSAPGEDSPHGDGRGRGSWGNQSAVRAKSRTGRQTLSSPCSNICTLSTSNTASKPASSANARSSASGGTSCATVTCGW